MNRRAKMSLFLDGKQYFEKKYTNERAFEQTICENYRMLLGNNTLYINSKQKIKTNTHKGTIPDGYLFDFELEDFYLVEVELAKHDAYDHILPQITKFFNALTEKSKKELINNIDHIVNSDEKLKKEFQERNKGKEIYRTISEIINNSSKILLIIDDNNQSLREISLLYNEWENVKILVIKEFSAGKNASIFTSEPDFAILDTPESNFEINADILNSEFTPEYHLQNSNNFVHDIYKSLENDLKKYPEIVFNVQKYYIALKKKRNFAYLKPKKNSLKIVLKLPYQQVISKVKSYQVKECTPPVKNFYGADCCWIKVDNTGHLNEILNVLEEAYSFN